MNPIFKQFQDNMTPPGVPENMRMIYRALVNSKNPYQLIEGMASSNPQLAQIMPLLKNQSPEQIVRQICQQRGINADDFIKQLK